MKCPNCNTEISNEQINIQKDIAQCIKCNNVFKISENITHSEYFFDLENTPKGTWYNYDGRATVIGATTRSPIAFFLVPFMIIWTGGSIGGIYGSQIANGEFNLFMSLFGIPFIIGSIIFWSIALMAIWGKVEITFDKYGGKIFTGIDDFGITQKFNWNDISEIREVENVFYNSNRNGGKICLEGKKRISFASGINDERRYYLFNALKSALSKVKMNKDI